jgi:hypothetical protein
MYEIKKAIIRISTEEFAENFKLFPGYADGAQTAREPNEVLTVDEYETLEEAEKAIDRTVDFDIEENHVTLAYEYISGSEDIYFDKLSFDRDYEIDSDFFVKDKAFKDAVIAKLKEFDLWDVED